MATTVSSFSAIDDTEVDADSPITESLVTRLRDNSYWYGTQLKTTATSTTVVLTPDGSGGTQFQEVATIATDGTKGSGTFSGNSGSPTQIAIRANKFLRIVVADTNDTVVHGELIIDSSDNTYVFASQGSGSGNGTIATSPSYTTTIKVRTGSATNLFARVNGSNYEFYSGSALSDYFYFWQ